jgi:hypothetical protein
VLWIPDTERHPTQKDPDRISAGDTDPHVFGPPGSGSVRSMDPDPSLFSLRKVLSRLKECLQNKILTQNFLQKNKFLRLKIMCLRISYKRKI